MSSELSRRDFLKLSLGAALAVTTGARLTPVEAQGQEISKDDILRKLPIGDKLDGESDEVFHQRVTIINVEAEKLAKAMASKKIKGEFDYRVIGEQAPGGQQFKIAVINGDSLLVIPEGEKVKEQWIQMENPNTLFLKDGGYAIKGEYTQDGVTIITVKILNPKTYKWEVSSDIDNTASYTGINVEVANRYNGRFEIADPGKFNAEMQKYLYSAIAYSGQIPGLATPELVADYLSKNGGKLPPTFKLPTKVERHPQNSSVTMVHWEPVSGDGVNLNKPVVFDVRSGNPGEIFIQTQEGKDLEGMLYGVDAATGQLRVTIIINQGAQHDEIARTQREFMRSKFPGDMGARFARAIKILGHAYIPGTRNEQQAPGIAALSQGVPGIPSIPNNIGIVASESWLTSFKKG